MLQLCHSAMVSSEVGTDPSGGGSDKDCGKNVDQGGTLAGRGQAEVRQVEDEIEESSTMTNRYNSGGT